MKLVWCPEAASKAFVDAVKALADCDLEDVSVAELVSALTGGWKAQLIVEAWAHDASAAIGIALRAAVGHARGRHVCVVPDKQSATKYVDAMRRAGAPVEAESVMTGEAEEVMMELEGLDLMVVDCRRRDAGRILRAARPGPRGMVVVCKGSGRRQDGGAARVFGAGTRVVRSTYLAIGTGVEVVHVGVGKGPSLGRGRARWIRHVDRCTKEEHVFRRR
ncbi:unnamed protein product [Musa acuminata var. zebrina]